MTLPISSLTEKHWPSAHAGERHASPSAPAEVTAEPFAELLGRLGAELDRGERLVDRAAAGVPTDDAGVLIAIQAGIYRYTETVDLAAKLVDGAANAARTTLQSGS